jgi:8-oxo-dGTP pyrophosphatase MutT (NUDIX family)
VERIGPKHLAWVEGDAFNQNGALCWRMHRGRVEVLLITSRDTGRWILPKGWPEPGLHGAEGAALEAWEEAGVVGEVSGEALGVYCYDKLLRPGHALPCIVTVFPLRVSQLRRRFPERGERRRKWFTAEKAARKVGEPDLRAILQSLAQTPERLEAGARA